MGSEQKGEEWAEMKKKQGILLRAAGLPAALPGDPFLPLGKR
jgi:hypothetical protein